MSDDKVKYNVQNPVDPHEQALQWFISCAVPKDELPSLIESIFSDEKTTNMVDHLPKSDAQAFINAIDGVCCHTF